MNIGLDITQAVKLRVRGIARYILEVLPHLLEQSTGGNLPFNPVLYVRAERMFFRNQVRKTSLGRNVRWLPQNYWLPGRGIDLYHGFGNHLPARSRVTRTFTVHDCRPLDLDVGKHRRLTNNVLRSDGILCLTEHGRSRLLHHFPDYDPERIVVVPHGVDHDHFRPQDENEAARVAQSHGLQRPFILQLGSWLPHKNLELAVSAYALSNARKEGLRLAFVGGGAGPEYRETLQALSESLGVEDMIDWVEDAPSDDIPALVAAASCLVQPSRYEGFGLPLLEAMAVGTPGVVSDSTCLPEVSGGVWPVFEQDDAEAFAHALDRLIFDTGLREATINEGIKHAAGFLWDETARRTIGFFSHMVKLGKREGKG